MIQTILASSTVQLIEHPPESEFVVFERGTVCPSPGTLLLLVRPSHPKRGDLSLVLSVNNVLIYGLRGDRYEMTTLQFTEVFCLCPVFGGTFLAPKEALVAELLPSLQAEVARTKTASTGCAKRKQFEPPNAHNGVRSRQRRANPS